MTDIQRQIYERCFNYNECVLMPEKFNEAFPFPPQSEEQTNAIQQFLMESEMLPSGMKLTFISPTTFKNSTEFVKL
jgi:hypothetical protein